MSRHSRRKRWGGGDDVTKLNSEINNIFHWGRGGGKRMTNLLSLLAKIFKRALFLQCVVFKAYFIFFSGESFSDEIWRMNSTFHRIMTGLIFLRNSTEVNKNNPISFLL